MRTLQRWLGGRGRFPTALAEQLRAEGVLLLREGLPGSMAYRHHRAHGYHQAREVEARSVAFAATRRRVVVFAAGMRVVDVPAGRPLPAGIAVASTDTSLTISYDAARFHADQSGTVTVTLHAPEAPQMRAHLGA